VIVGPTGVGKTELSIRLAERIGAEIVSSDSRQIFRQMRVGTAVPDEKQLARVPHHLIGELDIGDEYSAGIFAEKALERFEQIVSRDRRPLVTGGSTLYLRALREGLADVPDVDPDIRRDLNDRLRSEGATVLYRELARVDPAFARTLDETKSQRIVRGLEVYTGTGRPLSSFHAANHRTGLEYDITVLYRPRPILYRRIDERVDRMMASGLLDEVREVVEYADTREVEIPPTIGYRELIPVLLGDRPLDEGVRLVKRNSRRYAKRQLTWYRSIDDAVWIDLDAARTDDVLDELSARTV
jgi:tRNA dimethylallyltransferase